MSNWLKLQDISNQTNLSFLSELWLFYQFTGIHTN